MRSIAIIPAAGESRRMGQAKLLLPWRGKPIIQHVLDAWEASRVDQIVIVIRADDDALLRAIAGARTEVVVADPPPKEMKDSVALGLLFAAKGNALDVGDVWLLAPADMPRLSPDVIDRVLAEHDPSHPQILVPRAGQKNGHPVLFPWPLADEVEKLGPGEGINLLRARFPSRAVAMDDAAAAFADLDTPDDYRRLV